MERRFRAETIGFYGAEGIAIDCRILKLHDANRACCEIQQPADILRIVTLDRADQRCGEPVATGSSSALYSW